jgi:hypothetical protein
MAEPEPSADERAEKAALAEPGSPENASGQRVIPVRVGAFFLFSDNVKPDDLRAAIVKALEADSEVATVDVEPPEPTNDFLDETSIFPAVTDLDQKSTTSLLSGGDQQRSVQFETPIPFVVSVPRKNQPTVKPDDEVAAQRYFVLWDGWIVIVAWSQRDRLVPEAGGQIVSDILSRAVQKAGATLYVQACSPACKHLFNHTTLLVEQVESAGEPGPRLAPAPQWNTAILQTERSVESPVKAALAVYAELGTAVERFAQMKNLGRRILDLEDLARSQLLALMRIQYQRAHVWEHPIWNRPPMLWRLRDGEGHPDYAWPGFGSS